MCQEAGDGRQRQMVLMIMGKHTAGVQDQALLSIQASIKGAGAKGRTNRSNLSPRVEGNRQRTEWQLGVAAQASNPIPRECGREHSKFKSGQAYIAPDWSERR